MNNDSLHEICLDLITALNSSDEEILQDCIDRLAIIMEGKVLIPFEPTEALLESMAVRYDHGLGCPGYYDQPMFKSDTSHQERLESTIRTMRQIHEEVVGAGFYKHDK